MTIMRLSDRLALMFQRAFAQRERALPEGEDWAWEISVSPHAQQGTVLYIALMAPGGGTTALSTGLVVPGPGLLDQASVDSLAETLISQLLDAHQRAARGEAVAETNGALGD